LEILLLLSENPDTFWTVETTYAVILSTPASVERWLIELVRQDLFTCGPTTPATYRFDPPQDLEEQVAALAQFYKTAPVRVIEAVYRPRTDAAQTFADAFKLKKTDQK
jgi:hypothetical protein